MEIRSKTGLAADRSCVPPGGLTLLLGLQPEVVRSAILAGLSANVANGLARGRREISPALLVRFYPRESAVLISSASRLARWIDAIPIRIGLGAFHAALAAGRQASIEVVSGAGDAASCARAWREACRAAIGLLRAIDRDLGGHGIVRGHVEDGQLFALLRHAAAGSDDLVGSDGKLEMPEWAERRRSARMQLGCFGVLGRGGNEHRVLVCDISLGGAGLECGLQLRKGEQVELRIGRNISLGATVIWCRDGRAGVQFTMPLNGADHRLKFLTQAGSKLSGR